MEEDGEEEEETAGEGQVRADAIGSAATANAHPHPHPHPQHEQEQEQEQGQEERDPPPPTTTTTTTSSSSSKESQLKLQFLAVGGAPILKKNKFQVRGSMTVAEVVLFLRKTLKIHEADPVFVYVNSSFAPGLDQTVSTLHACFSVNGELVIQYAITASWG